MNKILVLLLFFTVKAAFAIEYKVLYVSSNDIHCGANLISVQDTINDSEVIDWGKSKSPYMIVKNVVTKQQRKLSGSEMKQESASLIKSFSSWINSFNNYYIKSNKTSTESLPSKLWKLNLLSEIYYLDDEISIEVFLPTDGKNSYFCLCSNTKKCKLAVISHHDKSFIMVSKSKLIEQGIISSEDINVHLVLQYKNPGLDKDLTKDLTFVLVNN